LLVQALRRELEPNLPYVKAILGGSMETPEFVKSVAFSTAGEERARHLRARLKLDQ